MTKRNLSPNQEAFMTKTFLRLLLSAILFSITSFGQIPKITENADNLERGREIIEKARIFVFGKKGMISSLKKISYRLEGESIQEIAATQRETATARKHTRNFKVEDRVSFEFPYKLELEMKSEVFDGSDTKIVHHSSRNKIYSVPDTTDVSEIVKNLEFFESLPKFNHFSDLNGQRSWAYVFPVTLQNYYGKAEENTKYVYVGKAIAPNGQANVIAVLTDDSYSPILYFDETSNHLLKMTVKIGGGNLEIFPGDYKLVKGIRIPQAVNFKQTTEIRDDNFGIDMTTVTIRETKLLDFKIE